MTDLVEDFLNGAEKNLADLESLFPLLEKNPADEKIWDSLDRFFLFIRSVAPFAGFFRSYRLSDAAINEIKSYRAKECGMTVLPAILMKFQRIKRILSAAAALKREPRESDNDLLAATVDKKKVSSGGADVVFAVERSDLAAQEAALDEREEQLVLWAQLLTEQEAALKQKENVLFEEEHRQALSQEKIASVLKSLNEQEKLQTDLEEHLAETRVALQGCQEKLFDRERQQERALQLLEAKNQALNEMGTKIQDLNLLLSEKENLSEQREEQLQYELQQSRHQAEELELNLKTLETFRSEINDDHQSILMQFKELEHEHLNAMSRLDAEKENTQRMLNEKRDLEKQHLEFNTQLISLQEELVCEKENLKKAEKALEQQKKRSDFMQAGLKAAAWPYNAEKIQKELSVLAQNGASKFAVGSLFFLKDLVRNIRTRSFLEIPAFFKKIAQKTAKKYQRRYAVAADCRIESNIDKQTADVAEQILAILIDNAFRFSAAPSGEELKMKLFVKEEGSFLLFSFSDNGTAFDFDGLYAAIQAAGLLCDADITAMTRKDMLAYLFHPAIHFPQGGRGLITAADLLEPAGGRIEADFEDGLQINFSLPKTFLFDKVLMFSLGGRCFALPLNAVAETVFLQNGEFSLKQSDNGGAFFYWKGMSLPVLTLGGGDEKSFAGYVYGLVIQAGAFVVLLPVEQIFDTEHLLSFSEKETGTPYLILCTVLESGREVPFVDLSKLLERVSLPAPKRIVTVCENQDQECRTGTVSYLVFKSETSVFGAVPVDAVLRVEDFSFPPASLIHKKYFETDGKRLVLKDSCPRDCYPYAQAVLIFDDFALAIQEVADIVEIPNVDPNGEPVDFIVYRGRKVPVFPTVL